MLCVQEAGGKVSNFRGEPWSVEQSDVLMTNGLVHDVMLDEIDKAGVLDMPSILTKS